MNAGDKDTALRLMDERFGRDALMALGTIDGDRPAVRAVNAYYEDGAFYVITHAASNKMKQLAQNPHVALCGEWFTAHGTGENMGWLRAPENAALAARLKEAFASWYDNGHIDEDDEQTVILRIRLSDGLLASHGTWYDIDFSGLREDAAKRGEEQGLNG